jgi:diguanylate cyclase (GGDEF)-like protein
MDLMSVVRSWVSSRQTSAEAGGDVRADTGNDIQRQFWLGHLRIGFGVFVGEAIFAMIYLGVTPNGPHRGVLWIVVASWFVCALANLLLAPVLASKQWRARFSISWTILSAFAVGGVANLDGGLGSPTMLLLFLPVAFAALAFTPRAAAECGLASLASVAFVSLTDSNRGPSGGGILAWFAVLVGASVLSVTASVNRTRRERHEHELAVQITEMATTDELTGCMVRRAFRERLNEEIARSVRYGRPLSLMTIDVDDFKSVNDTYGHLAGDRVLADVGRRLRSNARTGDVVARIGGDEFAVILPETEAAAAVNFAERIRREASQYRATPVTLSVGVSFLDLSDPTPEEMLEAADVALYAVKRAGRDGVAVRSPKPYSEITGAAPLTHRL